MTRKQRCSDGESGDGATFLPTVWIDSWAGEVVVTLSLPEELAHVAAESLQELASACSEGGSDAEAAEVAGLLLGFLDGVRIVRRPPATVGVPIQA